VNERAQAAAAKQKLKRAGGLIREAVRDLAIAADGVDVIGVFDVDSPPEIDAVGGALAVALQQRGPLQVQIVAAPASRPTTPPRPARAEEQQTT
jgi:hypothetical protein